MASYSPEYPFISYLNVEIVAILYHTITSTFNHSHPVIMIIINKHILCIMTEQHHLICPDLGYVYETYFLIRDQLECRKIRTQLECVTIPQEIRKNDIPYRSEYRSKFISTPY